MSAIKVTNEDGDVFTFDSYEGHHYWCVEIGKSSNWYGKENYILPVSMNQDCYKMAIAAGFCNDDFDKVRTHSKKSETSSEESGKRTNRKSVYLFERPEKKAQKAGDSIKLF